MCCTFRHTISITADRKRNRPAKKVVWTTQAPPTSRRRPEDIMTKASKMSDEATAAETEVDFWSLFFTQEMVTLIVSATNDKIEEDFVKKAYTDEYLKKAPHIDYVDEVNNCVRFEKNSRS
jgi:hypothetical protein